MSENRCRRLACALPHVIDSSEISSVTDEWKLYSLENIPDSWFVVNKKSAADTITTDSESDVIKSSSGTEKGAVPSCSRIDEYWAKVLDIRTVTGTVKYATLGKVVLAALALAHGNADAERSFSANKKVVTPQRVSLCESTVTAIRLVKDALRCHADGKASQVAITPSLLQSARGAHRVYKVYLEEKTKKEEEEKRKRLVQQQQLQYEEKKKNDQLKQTEQRKQDIKKLRAEDEKLAKAEVEQRNILRSTASLLKEAEGKLSEAIKSGNMDTTAVAHGLLEVARKRMDDANSELVALAKKRETCQAKQKRHIDDDMSTTVKRSKTSSH